MTEFRKYKPRELMDGLLDGRTYEIFFTKEHRTFICIVGDYLCYMDSAEKSTKFLKTKKIFSMLDVYIDYKIGCVGQERIDEFVKSRRRKIKSEKV